jgi:putative transposase
LRPGQPPVDLEPGWNGVATLPHAFLSYAPRMGHKHRIEVAGGLYHVTSRGNARQPIFLDDFDYATFLQWLSKTIERFEWRCHGFCLMPNHFHLMLETPDPNLALGMQLLIGTYARRFNWRYRRAGHVFQGPYHSTMVEREPHLLELCRYIAMNPVRADLVADLADWPWSSYRATAGLERVPPYLRVDRVRSLFAVAGSSGAEGFRDFVAAPNVTLDLAA